MDVAITGSSGLIGQALTASLRDAGHRPISVVRRAASGADEIAWNPADGTIDAESFNGVDAVVHLAGAGIGDRRWTDERKKVLVDSRIDGTSLLASTLAGLDRPPSVLVSGSAIGIYGSRGDEELTESSARGTGFLADLVEDWERSAQPAVDAGIRTAFARTGVVMTPNGGVLKKQLPLFKLGLGGRFGPGDQWLGWISLDDEVRALEFLLEQPVSGPVNLTSPEPFTNIEFTKALGSVLGRPTLLPVPLFGPKLLFGGEFVDEAILASQRVLPKALLDAGFVFEQAAIEPALRSMLGR